MDLSFIINKDELIYGGTPNVGVKKTQFSPHTPNVQLNTIAVGNSNNTPNNHFRHQQNDGVVAKNNHFDCETNYGEEYYEESRSQFRETIKSSSTDLRSAMADIDNLNIKLNHKRQELGVQN